MRLSWKAFSLAERQLLPRHAFGDDRPRFTHGRACPQDASRRGGHPQRDFPTPPLHLEHRKLDLICLQA